MNLIECTEEIHSQAILDIFNEAILNSTALYDYQPRPLASMRTWFDAKRNGCFPVVGMENEQGMLMGFASYGSFRAWPAYKYSVEHSVYVHHAHRGKGLGLMLMQRLIERAAAQDKHVMVGAIDASNQVSIGLHERLGFAHAGTVKQAAFKFGKWLDLAFYQRVLGTPAQPVDG